MAEKIIPCGQAPQVVIRAERDLSIRGGEPGEIKATLEDLRDLSAVESEGWLTIRCEEDCALRIPVDANLVIDEVSGSVSISDFPGGLKISRVGGNLSLNQIGDVESQRVSGNCRVARVGRMRIEGLGGNLKGSDILGPLSARGVGGNIKVIAIGSLETLEAGGNIRASLLEIHNDMTLTAGGNIRLFIPPEAGFVLNAASGGQRVLIHIGEQTRKVISIASEMAIGGGGPRVNLTAGGNITLTDSQDEEAEGEEFNVEVDTSALHERFQKRIEEKVRRAERRAEAAQRRAEARVREAMKQVGGIKIGGVEIFEEDSGWSAGPGRRGVVPAEESERVTDEERLLILNMLHEKKITAEEADRLLDALEGKFHKIK